MPNVKVALVAGYDPTWALKGCLRPNVKEWAEARGLNVPHVSGLINGSTDRRHERIRQALVETLKVERWWLDELLQDIRAEWVRKQGR